MAALRSLTPDDIADIEHDLERVHDELRYLRGKRAGFQSSLAKVEWSIAANERAVIRLEGLLTEDAA